jgi:trehalose 6-phosphate phosphatase
VIPLLSREGTEALERIATARALLAFDYDGTLAPYTDDRDAANMRPETRALLQTAAILYPCAVVSGRVRGDVAQRFEGIPLVAVIGNHGAEAGFGPLDKALKAQVDAWHARLAPGVANVPGVEIENKGYSLALHHRRAPSWDEARRRIRELVGGLGGALVIEGNAAVNVLPEGAPTKAEALRELCRRFLLDVVVYVGDDRSDEDAFGSEVVTVPIRVGPDEASRARYSLVDQAELDELLRTLVLVRARMDGRQGYRQGVLRALTGEGVPGDRGGRS